MKRLDGVVPTRSNISAPSHSSDKKSILSNGMKVALAVTGTVIGIAFIKTLYTRFTPVDPVVTLKKGVGALNNPNAGAQADLVSAGKSINEWFSKKAKLSNASNLGW